MLRHSFHPARKHERPRICKNALRVMATKGPWNKVEPHLQLHQSAAVKAFVGDTSQRKPSQLGDVTKLVFSRNHVVPSLFLRLISELRWCVEIMVILHHTWPRPIKTCEPPLGALILIIGRGCGINDTSSKAQISSAGPGSVRPESLSKHMTASFCRLDPSLVALCRPEWRNIALSRMNAAIASKSAACSAPTVSRP